MTIFGFNHEEDGVGGFDHGLCGVSFLSSFGEWCSKRGYLTNIGD